MASATSSSSQSLPQSNSFSAIVASSSHAPSGSRPLGDGLHEFRVRHDEGEIVRMFGAESSGVVGSGETVLLRVFVDFYGAKVVLLLGGYDKGADS
jgi:hypothetical protein